MRRTIRMFGVAVVAALALAAFGASAAQAGHTWEVNGVKLAAGETRECKATSDPTNVPANTLTLKATLLAQPFHLTSTGIVADGCKIIQDGAGATAVATDTVEKLTFTGMKVDEPAGCTTANVTTVAIKSEVITVAGVAYTTFTPESATNGTWANIVVSGCALAETYPIKGSVCAEMPDGQAGQLATSHTTKFSAKADEACPSDKLTMGGQPVILRGGIILELVSDLSWGFTAT